jgi:hypothetical protein
LQFARGAPPGLPATVHRVDGREDGAGNPEAPW